MTSYVLIIQIVQYPGLAQWKHWGLKWKYNIFSLIWNIVWSCNHTFNLMHVSLHKLFLPIPYTNCMYEYFLNKIHYMSTTNIEIWIYDLFFHIYLGPLQSGFSKCTIISNFFVYFGLNNFHTFLFTNVIKICTIRNQDWWLNVMNWI